MPLLSPRERHDLRTSRITRYYEMEKQFEVVTSIYPAQRLTVHLDIFSIMQIMDCDKKDASALLRGIGKKIGNEFGLTLRTSVFCDHMDIDEMLIQVFLASMDQNFEP